ncbi:nuclear receptor-binding protein-like [Saccoglossus kowalevskii]|uniref:Nuclear receptor-binding protein-like n=1 Tax=Saccoglossus kowalevskii TaxID=10224 RepID=A0ABM0GXU5_SACKO|nr:PREDICTED: nuclear receptor-binding protein-like [Saccoglossus kowalevskii]
MSSEPEDKAAKDSGDESEDEEVLEESPCGRWQKRREEVTQRDVPGIDVAYLAMDTEEGVEVVWNEVQFSERRNFKAQEEKIKLVFDNLIQLEHVNIVKFHKYWTDVKTEKPRVIFITEYMSSGSLKQFLKRTKKNKKTINEKSWKRWCTQILSALSYLHSCEPPIIHGNLTCDTIFIQHNGLIKIGSVAPDTIHNHVKTYREEQKNMHYIAPEYGGLGEVTTAVDIYAFGISALEMACLGLQNNGDGTCITKDTIFAALGKIEDRLQSNFIRCCLTEDCGKRPTARELLFHQVLFEVHSLKLLAAHSFFRHERLLPENLTTEAIREQSTPEKVMAEISHQDGREGVQWKCKQVPILEYEKFLEDVRNGIYPLTAFALQDPHPGKPRPPTPEIAESVKSNTPDPVDVELRQILQMQCNVSLQKETAAPTFNLTIILRMDDKMNRQLDCDFSPDDNSYTLAEELVHFGFINVNDRDKVANLIEEQLKMASSQSAPSLSSSSSSASSSSSQEQLPVAVQS